MDLTVQESSTHDVDFKVNGGPTSEANQGNQAGQEDQKTEAKTAEASTETSKEVSKDHKKSKRKAEKAKFKPDRMSAHEMTDFDPPDSEDLDFITDDILDHEYCRYEQVRYPQEESFRTRFEENFDIYQTRICPEINVKLYIKKVDEMLVIDNAFQELDKKACDLFDTICSDFKRGPVRRNKACIEKKRFFEAVVDAYKNIKIRIEKGPKDREDRDNLVAALEATGQIIITPQILNLVRCEYRREAKQEPFLRLTEFASRWSCCKLDRIGWPLDRKGLSFHFVKRSFTFLG